MTNITYPFIDYSQVGSISSKAKRIVRKRMDRITDFHQLRTLHKEDDLSGYGKQVDRYFYEEPVEQVWNAFTRTVFHKMWEGPMVKYLFAFSKEYDQFFYPADDNLPAVHEGLQVFCLLSITSPVGVVGLEIGEIDEDTFSIELAYLEGGWFRGVQRLEMVEQALGGTQIVHTSYYKAENRYASLIPYRFFHKRTAGEFHKTMNRLTKK